MIALIDNYDSFTYNLVQYFGELGAQVQVLRNDQIGVEELVELAPERLVISPGPGTPGRAGISVEAVRRLEGRIPILGVCLGHQCIGEAFGGNTVHAQRIMHGKTSPIRHNDKDLFQNVENPFTATRYHSLVIDRNTLPECLQITAWTSAQEESPERTEPDAADAVGEIMAVRHSIRPIFGLQFHPESILTLQGHDILHNFLHQS